MKGPNNWSWLRSANTGRAIQNSCVVSWPISFRLHRVDIEQCLNEKKNYSFLAGCYQLCKSSNVCSHNTCLLILNGTSLGNSSPQLSLVLLTILFPQLWKNIDHGLSNGMAVCVERIVPLQELTRTTWPFPWYELCAPILSPRISLIKLITRLGIMQIHVSGLGDDIHTTGLITRLSRIVWVIKYNTCWR